MPVVCLVPEVKKRFTFEQLKNEAKQDRERERPPNLIAMAPT